MAYMLLGLVLFTAVHLVPDLGDSRARLIRRLGPLGYQGAFSLVALAGLGLLVFGYGQRDWATLFDPAPGSRTLAQVLMPIALVLLAAAYLPGRLRARARHPMLLAVALWAALHLLANGDLGSSLLFGGILAFALLKLALARRRVSPSTAGRAGWGYDVAALAAGLAAYALLLQFHAAWFGAAVGW